MGETILKLEGIKKSFGDVTVLNGIDLTVEKGEFITLLGSSRKDDYDQDNLRT